MIEIHECESIKIPIEERLAFQAFLKGMSARREVGFLRYGKTDRKQRYMTRLKKELKSYENVGNMEQLLNIAVYAFLEFYKPENKKYHFDNTVGSVTRDESPKG